VFKNKPVRFAMIVGVVQLQSIFYDTERGMLPGKNPNHLLPYPAIVMENVEGETVKKRIDARMEQRLIVDETYFADLFKSIVTALLGIHERGFIHRDIKADNVLLVSKDVNSLAVKIIDFGFMVRVGESGSFQDTRVLGSEGCFAPESLLRQQYSRQSDVWQMGCLLYRYSPACPQTVQCVIGSD
jgi:serine/threonine protein kinase